MPLFRTSSLRVAFVLLTAVAWLAVSNHCALAATVFSPQQKVSACSACHDQGDQTPVKSGEAACCKVLKATASDVTKSNALPPPLLSGETDYAVIARLARHRISGVPGMSVMPAGPPMVRSFSELVLNRSLPALAPPVFVA